MNARKYIEDRSIPIPFAGCWLWLRSFFNHGYAQGYSKDEPNRLAHRISFRAFKGPIPNGALIQHSCDRPWCVNPDHLSIGTDRSNTIDMFRKGRGKTKLTEDQVRSIREASGAGQTQQSIARRFGISQSLVHRIVHRTLWGHVS